MTVTICCQSMFRAIQHGAIKDVDLTYGEEKCHIEVKWEGNYWWRNITFCPFCGKERPLIATNEFKKENSSDKEKSHK